MFDTYGPEARAVLDELLDSYAEHGIEQFALPEALHVPPLSARGTVNDIIRLFGGPDRLRAAVDKLQELIYAAKDWNEEDGHPGDHQSRRDG